MKPETRDGWIITLLIGIAVGISLAWAWPPHEIVKDDVETPEYYQIKKETNIFKFELHQVVKDKVTGFTGVILGRTEYATGCRQYGVVPQKLTEDGKLLEWEWFDETRLELTGKTIASLTELGGPSPRPPSKN